MVRFEGRAGGMGSSAPGAPRQSICAGMFVYRREAAGDVNEHAQNFMGRDHTVAQIARGKFSGALQQAWLDNIQVSLETADKPHRQEGSHWGDAILFLLLGGLNEGCYSEGRYFSGDSLYATHGNELHLTSCTGINTLSVVVPRRQFWEIERVLEAMPGARARSRIIPLTEHNRVRLRRAGISILQQLGANPDLTRDAAFRKNAPHELISVLAEVLSDSTGCAEEAPRASVRGFIVNRACELIAEHEAANEEAPLTVADLCRKLRVSRRTLQYSFTEILGIGPNQYLMAMRLNRVRRMLRCFPVRERIQDVAFDCGFGHSGRLAHHYRSFFGELPSET